MATAPDPFQIVRESLNSETPRYCYCIEPHEDVCEFAPPLAALDQIEAELEGHRENADVLAAMTATLKRVEAERDRLREALRKIRTLPPLYIRPSGGKDFHQCQFLARAALSPEADD